ncbi:ATP binding/alanine-tRNA ligase [Diplocarpon rosae]|nr:ATP binding/alanine-tRNA ligase [Diplocarpon rosae]
MATRTKLVYQQHQDLRQHASKLTSLSPVSSLSEPDQALFKNATEQDYALVTDETIFYVQGGGQPSDTGTISSGEPRVIFQVSAARHPAAGGAILHFGRFNPPSALSRQVFTPGCAIEQSIDASRRDLYSRLHTAGHILGLAINALCREGVLPPLKESKASHYPDSAAVERRLMNL